jgi:4-hydroxy-tetrahydrodipicolinate synthase
MTGELPRIVPAAVTPFSEGGRDLALDWIPPYLSYIEHRGADGVLPLGTNGEGPSLSLQERKDVIDAVLTHRGRLRVIAGTGCAALPETIELSQFALERGVDAVMIVPPFYFKDVDTPGLVAYYTAVLSALPPERKVLLYNIPAVSGVEVSDELLDALAQRFPDRLLGLKDTSGDVARTRRYIERFPQLLIYNGADGNIAQALASGAYGTISGIANVFPDLVAEVFAAADAGSDAQAAQARLDRARSLLDGLPPHAATKRLLHRVAGLPLVPVRPPLRDLTPEEADLLDRRLEASGLA